MSDWPPDWKQELAIIFALHSVWVIVVLAAFASERG